jgi:hypothetical protein
MEIDSNRIRERMYQVYNDQIPLLNSNPIPIDYNGKIYGNGLRNINKFIPVQAGAGYVNQPAPSNYMQNEGLLKVNKQTNPEYSYLDYADWVEFVGRQIAASNGNTVSKGDFSQVDEDGNIAVQNKSTKLLKLIEAKKKAMGGCSNCHLNFDIDPETHFDNTAFKLGSALDRKKHVKNLSKILKHIKDNHGGSMGDCAKIFHKAYRNVHGDDYSFYEDLVKDRFKKGYVPNNYRYDYY